MSIRLRQPLFVISGDFSTQICDLQKCAVSHKFGNKEYLFRLAVPSEVLRENGEVL